MCQKLHGVGGHRILFRGGGKMDVPLNQHVILKEVKPTEGSL